MDVMRADTVDADLDRLISRRASADRTPDPDELEPTYVESVRLFNARVRAENRASWHAHHDRLRALYARLSAEHGAKAEDLMEATDEQRRTA